MIVRIIFYIFLVSGILNAAKILPYGIVLNNDKMNSTLEIKNTNGEKEVYYAELFKVVHSDDGFTKFEQSDDFIIFPSVIRLNPNTTRKVKVFYPSKKKKYGRYYIKIVQLTDLKQADELEQKEQIDGTKFDLKVAVAKYIRIDIVDNNTVLDNKSIDFKYIEQTDSGLIINLKNNTNQFLRLTGLTFFLGLDDKNQAKKFVLNKTIQINPKSDIKYKFTSASKNNIFLESLDKTHVQYKVNDTVYIDDSIEIR